MNKLARAIGAGCALLCALSSGTALAQAGERTIGEGARLAVTTGYDTIVGNDDLTGAQDNIPDTLESLRIGIEAGYDVKLSPRWSIGGEIGWGQSVAGGIDASFARDRLRLEPGRDLDVSARIGYLPSDTVMVYAKAGYANSGAVATLEEWVGSGYETTTVRGNTDGLRLGLGVETALSDRLYAKAEYRWTRYGDFSYQQDASRHQLLAGVGVRF